MPQTITLETIRVDGETATTADGPAGCLLQIHPVQIDTGRVTLGETTVIGRDGGCDLTVSDVSVSRQHARVELCGDHYVVTDLGSTNGTWVNDTRVTTTLLAPGDRIRFGSVVFKFLPLSDIESQHHEAVYQMMTRDSLTGVWNKRYFLEVLDRDLRRNVRHDRPTSLVLFDIDHFKSINDTHGHLAGDEVLREMGQRISAVLNNDEVLARYGGEEFAIVVSEATAAEAVELAERCRAVVEAEPFDTCDGELAVTISLGVADATDAAAVDSTELISRTDMKLYEAKRGGRNRVCR